MLRISEIKHFNMESKSPIVKRIALVAHDNRKKDLVEWVEWNWEELMHHKLVCTGTTGKLVEEALTKKNKVANDKVTKLDITILKSGPLGGDQQLGAMIAEGKIDMLIFLWDPMQQQPHDVDVKALLRISVLYNVPNACNRSTADFLISSDLMHTNYKPTLKDYSAYIKRHV
jgi:methylglyoxal synthase